jgi:hypothetical protein
MSQKYTDYPPVDAKLVSDHLADKKHAVKANAAKWQREINKTAEKSFQQMTFNNKKAAAKTQRENQEFGMAVNLAALLSEIKLLLHYKTMVEKILEVGAEVDAKSQQRYQELLADQRNPFPITLPQPEQSTADYRKNILNDAMIFLDSLSEKQAALQNRIRENWGADNWQDGLKKQADALHEKINERIENYEFLNVIETADGNKIDITQLAPEVAETARAAMHEVNDSLKSFINEIQPPEPSNYEKFDIAIGEQAPLAPTLDPLTLTSLTSSIGGNRSQAETDLEVFLINEYRKGFGKIGEPLIKEKEIVIDPETKTSVNANSNIRLALRSTDTLSNDVKNLADKAQKFVNDTHLLNGVNKLVENAKQDLVKLQTELQATISPRPHPR